MYVLVVRPQACMYQKRIRVPKEEQAYVYQKRIRYTCTKRGSGIREPKEDQTNMNQNRIRHTWTKRGSGIRVSKEDQIFPFRHCSSDSPFVSILWSTQMNLPALVQETNKHLLCETLDLKIIFKPSTGITSLTSKELHLIPVMINWPATTSAAALTFTMWRVSFVCFKILMPPFPVRTNGSHPLKRYLTPSWKGHWCKREHVYVADKDQVTYWDEENSGVWLWKLTISFFTS